MPRFTTPSHSSVTCSPAAPCVCSGPTPQSSGSTRPRPDPPVLPSRAPELNPVENIWQYLRQNWLSNRVFETYEAIIEAACDAWRSLLAEPTTITSIGHRGWAHVGQK